MNKIETDTKKYKQNKYTRKTNERNREISSQTLTIRVQSSNVYSICEDNSFNLVGLPLIGIVVTGSNTSLKWGNNKFPSQREHS